MQNMNFVTLNTQENVSFGDVPMVNSLPPVPKVWVSTTSAIKIEINLNMAHHLSITKPEVMTGDGFTPDEHLAKFTITMSFSLQHQVPKYK